MAKSPWLMVWLCLGCASEESSPSVSVDARVRVVAPDGPDALPTMPMADGGEPALDAGADPLADAGLIDATPFDAAADPDAVRLTPGDGGWVCGEISAVAEGATRPVDIVWIIDASPSMDEEIAQVEANLNAWAARIGASGLDYRVVLIGADRQACGDGRCYFEICVPPPLSGAAGCPDADGPRFRHVRQGVHSGDGLDVAAATVEQWRPFLRPDSELHFVMVTDDDQGWGLDAQEFLDFLAPFPQQPRFHSVVDEVGRLPSCGLFGEPECSCGEEAGETYMTLSARTGGLVHSVCEADWDPIFDALERVVVEGADIPCAFDVPVLPEGVELDPERVNVDQVRGGVADPLDNVGTADECAGLPGWYYDDPETPTQVHLCPEACGADAAEVRVVFGCEMRKR